MSKRVAAMIGAAMMFSAAASADATPLPKPPAFSTCAMCHKVEQGAPNIIGPNLWGIGGQMAGTVPGFKYTPAMTNAKIPWNRDNLIAFITNPKAKVPGTRMAYAGQKDPKVAAAIADYLLSLK